jgi:alkanesulfonate monooxygenase SsuD/methylene tetrahydromethanopterin reductase-like flavin-dependent oxidoreductase (luciferase family)
VEFVSGVYRQDFGPLADRYLLHGDPDTVTARLTKYHAAGAKTVIFSPACAPERHADVTALFALAVRPRLPPA